MNNIIDIKRAAIDREVSSPFISIVNDNWKAKKEERERVRELKMARRKMLVGSVIAGVCSLGVASFLAWFTYFPH